MSDNYVVQISYTGINDKGVGVMVNVRGENFADVIAIVESDAGKKFIGALQPTPVKTYAGFGGKGKPQTIDLDDAPVNASGVKFQPVKNPRTGSFFWAISKWNPSKTKPDGSVGAYDTEYAPQGTKPPTEEQYKKFLELNPHKVK